uniref:N/A n=1 Tax=Ganoderma boninense TaxID=34458 RepID=A0A5K1JUC9_9APHY|nr:N/A [Ganoderma boninense]
MTKYRVRTKLGRGSFGTVVLAEDTLTDTAVAIKLLHKDPDLHEDVRHEENVYRTLLAGCDPRIELFAEAITSGTHRGFHCIVFELCGATLYDMVHGCMGLLPFPARHILEIAYQLVKAVDCLPWGSGVDTFAVGLMIAEIFLGSQLFSSDISSDREHLAALDRVLGPFPRGFAHTVDARFPGTFSLDDDIVKVHYPPLDTVVTRDSYGDSMRRLERMRPLSADMHDPELVDLINRLTSLDPAKRIALNVAGKHTYFDAVGRGGWQ